MALATLTIDINAKLASIEKDLGKLSQMAQAKAEQIEQAFSAVGGAVAGMFVGLGVGGLVAGFRGLVDQIDALNDAADATGSSIENISGLEDIAKRTGGSLEDVTSTLVKFNGVLSSASPDNGVGAALRSIGLDAQELRKLDPADALLETAQALAQFEDDGNKARLVQELFGKSVREVAPLLKNLAEAGKINAKYTSEQAAEAEKFNKQLAELSTNVSSAGRAIANEILPYLNKMFDVLGDRDVETLASHIKEFEDALRKEPYNKEYARRLEELRAAYAAISDEAKVAAGLLSAGGGRGFVNPDTVKPRVLDFSTPDSPKKPTPDSPKKPTTGGSVSRVTEIQREIDALQRKVQATQNLTEVQRVLADFESGKYKGANASDLGKAFDLAGQIDQANELEAAWERVFDELDQGQRLAARNAQEANAYFEASLTPAEKLEATIKRINDLYEQGAFGATGSAEAIEKQARAIKAASDESSKLNEAARDMADIFTRAAESGDDLGKALETIIKKKLIFEPMAKSLESGFQSLFAFAGSFFGGGSSSAPVAGSGLKLTPSASSAFLPGHADGLPYVPYDNYVARLHKGERVLTAQENKAYASGGGGITIINQNQIGSGVSRADVAAAMELSKQATMAEILESRRNRGVFA